MRNETKNINKSIYALGNCIQALAKLSMKCRQGKKKIYVPYRDSKLTRLLAEPLSKGNTRFCIVCNVNPMLHGYAETVCSLTFAKKYVVSSLSDKNIPDVFFSY